MEFSHSSRSFTYLPPLVVLLLCFCSSSFAQDRKTLCDAGKTASVAHKAQLEQQLKPMKASIARISTQLAAINKKYFKPKDPKAKGWQRVKNLRLPHLKSTLELMRSVRDDLQAQKTRLEAQLAPLQASMEFVEKIGALFDLAKQEKDAVDRKVIAKRIENGVAVPLAAAQAQVKHLQERLKLLQVWARSKNVASLVQSTQQELTAAQAEATFWGQYQTYAKKLQ